MNFPWDQLLVKGNWMIISAQIAAPFLVIGLYSSYILFQIMEISI